MASLSRRAWHAAIFPLTPRHFSLLLQAVNRLDCRWSLSSSLWAGFMKEDALKILHDPTLKRLVDTKVGLPTAAVESGGMLGHVEELHKSTFGCGVPNTPCVVSMPSFAFGQEVPLCAFELGIEVEVKPFYVAFPEAVSCGLLAFRWQVVFKVINYLLCHAFCHFVVLGFSIHFSIEFHSECGMDIKVVMFNIESVD